MPRDLIPYSTGDVSALAKSLRAQLAGREAPPSHVEMLNILARAAGHRNFQHFRARAGENSTSPPAPSLLHAADQPLVQRAARYFDEAGRLAIWPARTNLQNLCMWGLWSRIPAGQVLHEREVNALLNSLHLFGDPAILRRTLCQIGLMTRPRDCRDYRRVERPPTAEAAALIGLLSRARAS